LLRRYSIIALMMEAVITSETSVNIYHTTRRKNPEDSHFLAKSILNNEELPQQWKESIIVG
jgi:hypothetical protein